MRGPDVMQAMWEGDNTGSSSQAWLDDDLVLGGGAPRPSVRRNQALSPPGSAGSRSSAGSRGLGGGGVASALLKPRSSPSVLPPALPGRGDPFDAADPQSAGGGGGGYELPISSQRPSPLKQSGSSGTLPRGDSAYSRGSAEGGGLFSQGSGSNLRGSAPGAGASNSSLRASRPVPSLAPLDETAPLFDGSSGRTAAGGVSASGGGGASSARLTDKSMAGMGLRELTTVLSRHGDSPDAVEKACTAIQVSTHVRR